MKTTIASVLLSSAACLVPAYANYFHNPRTNTNLNIGSAPNPTPADLRAIGDFGVVGAVVGSTQVLL